MRAQTFSNLHRELASLSSLEQKLHASRLSLGYACNSSGTLARINRLPSEVLVMIFTLATQRWINHDYVAVESQEVSATSLSSVCSQWRSLMLQSAPFWTRIDLDLSGIHAETSYLIADLWVDRSQNAPLEVSVAEGEGIQDSGVIITSWDVDRAVRFLSPLMQRVSAFQIQAYGLSSSDPIDKLLACWIKEGQFGSARSLGIFMDDSPWNFPGNGDMYVFPIRFSEFFGSLKTLSLCNAMVAFDNLVFSGLVELRLEFMHEWNPTTSEIAKILSCSPKLRLLTLINVQVSSLSTPAPSSAVLNDLETLTLESERPSDLWSILQSISSSSSAIRLSLMLEEAHEYMSELQSFVMRCKVVMLCLVRNTVADRLFAASIPRAPYLRTLALKNLVLTHNVVYEGTILGSYGPPTLELWPTLREMHIIDCNPHEDFLKRFANLLRPQESIVLYENTPEHLVELKPDVRQRLQEELVKSGIKLEWGNNGQCYADPTCLWTFVHN
ncbi:F-box-like protein [Ceratobasidium sp. AG-Ba]|nr:F-box-like protein [Ceratobasidium sp. AG-Ba]